MMVGIWSDSANTMRVSEWCARAGRSDGPGSVGPGSFIVG